MGSRREDLSPVPTTTISNRYKNNNTDFNYYIILVADCIMFTIMINLTHDVLFYLSYLKGGHLHVFETGYLLRTGNLFLFWETLECGDNALTFA